MSKAKQRIQQQEGICHGNTLLMQGQTLLTVSHFLPASALLIGRQAVVFVVFSAAVTHTARDSAEINFAEDPQMIRSCSSVQSLSAAGGKLCLIGQSECFSSAAPLPSQLVLCQIPVRLNNLYDWEKKNKTINMSVVYISV